MINSVYQLLLLGLVHEKNHDILKPQFPGLGKKLINKCYFTNLCNRVIINPVQNFVGDCVYIA